MWNVRKTAIAIALSSLFTVGAVGAAQAQDLGGSAEGAAETGAEASGGMAGGSERGSEASGGAAGGATGDGRAPGAEGGMGAGAGADTRMGDDGAEAETDAEGGIDLGNDTEEEED
ncbi:hypothetical protein [Thioalkalivibrio sp. ALE30]|uniref:hypothetical protein n=1 Tax=Thioalkalivibrio sp. ALE30 TaxID=1158181 RepID=UPI00037A55F0|nr:hypothetical protein [Thioalkalivibrio sp. ALE30]